MPRESGGGCTRGLQVKQIPKPTMASTRDLKTGCETLETPDAIPETADSQTTGAKFEHCLLFNTLHRLIKPFKLERPVSSLSSTTNLPLKTPLGSAQALHRLKVHQSRQSCNERQPLPFSSEGKLRHGRVMLLQSRGRGRRGPRGGKWCLCPAKDIWQHNFCLHRPLSS